MPLVIHRSRPLHAVSAPEKPVKDQDEEMLDVLDDLGASESKSIFTPGETITEDSQWMRYGLTRTHGIIKVFSNIFLL